MKITKSDTRISVESPYNANFVVAAKRLGGRWDAGSHTWTFDVRDEPKVRDLCRKYYGTDGETVAPGGLVSLRVRLNCRDEYQSTANDDTVTIQGRTIVRKIYRDSSPKLGEGVIIESGRFPSCGGSVKNPRIGDDGPVVLLVRDIPRALAEAEVAKYNGIEIVESVDEKRTALLSEKAKLLSRLEAIENELNPMVATDEDQSQASEVAIENELNPMVATDEAEWHNTSNNRGEE